MRLLLVFTCVHSAAAVAIVYYLLEGAVAVWGTRPQLGYRLFMASGIFLLYHVAGVCREYLKDIARSRLIKKRSKIR